MEDAVTSGILGKLLNSRLEITQVRDEHFPRGHETKAQVVSTCRFILVTGGSVDYKVEDRTATLATGHAVFVPPWVWRTWTVPTREGIDLLWVVFSVAPGIFTHLDSSIEVRHRDFALLAERMAALFSRWKDGVRPALSIEAEVKAILAIFFETPEVLEEMRRAESRSGAERHPEIRKAVRWLREHYSSPHALAEMQESVALNPDYFRDLFHRQVHQTPNQYLTQLRMRAARHFLAETTMRVGEVAGKCGFTDPQYFTRAYRKFWGRAPSAEPRND